MTQLSPSKYWIDSQAIIITLNAMDLPDYIQVSITNSAVIMAHADGIAGLDYDAGHNYRRWHLTASPTYFYTHTAKYVHIAIPRNGNDDAQVVFPSEELDIYGKNKDEKQIGSERYYYIFLGGILTSSGADGKTPRTWQSQCQWGTLHTDEAISNPDSDWYQYSTVDQIASFLKNLTMKAGTLFINLFAHKLAIKSYGEEKGSITFENGNGEIEKVAEFGSLSDESPKQIVTPAYLKDREAKVEEKYLRKDKDDETKFGLTMASLKVNGKADVFGNLVAESTTHLKGNTTIGSPATVPSASPEGTADMQHWGKSEWGTFIKGIITGSGAQIDINGNAELESLVIRRFLEVPELRYNRVSVHSGTDWFTKGSGLIESVEQTDATHGTITLHVEDGEYGTLAVDDYCMGIFHNLDGNATENQDDRNGVLQYKGFTTVYFFITAVRGDHNDILDYELRPVSDLWTQQVHPCSQMTFACYANPNNTDRQSGVLKTTDYTVYIENSTQWTFGPDNYYLIMGQLDGFSVWATNKATGKRYLKKLHGNGTMLGNVYMFGEIDQFNRLADRIELTVSPRINADFTIADGETLTLTAQMQSYDGIKRTGVIYNIKRYSDNQEADAEWNARRGNDIKDGTIALTTEDTKISEGMFDPAVQFTIVATRQLPSEEGGDLYIVERDFILKNVGGFTLTDDLGYDIFIDPNESKVITFDVDSPRSGTVTQQVTSWRIERDSGDASADLTWNNSVKALTFRNPTLPHRIEIEQSDLSQIRDYTKFLITAYFNDTPIAQTEYTI